MGTSCFLVTVPNRNLVVLVYAAYVCGGFVYAMCGGPFAVMRVLGGVCGVCGVVCALRALCAVCVLCMLFVDLWSGMCVRGPVCVVLYVYAVLCVRWCMCCMCVCGPLCAVLLFVLYAHVWPCVCGVVCAVCAVFVCAVCAVLLVRCRIWGIEAYACMCDPLYVRCCPACCTRGTDR